MREMNMKINSSVSSYLKIEHCRQCCHLNMKAGYYPIFIGIISFVFFLISLSIHVFPANAESMMKIDEGDNWYFHRGMMPPADKWHTADYDASGWERGPAGFGYGEGRYITALNDMRGNYSGVYARRKFNVTNPEAVSRLSLSIGCDSSFTAYINGIEVISNSTYLNEVYDVSGFIHELFRGENILAIHCNNDDIRSESFTFNPYFEVHYETIR